MENKRKPGFTKKMDRLVNYLIYNKENKERSVYFRYGVPLLLVILVTLLKLNFTEAIGVNNPYLLYFGIVCLSAILGGIGPAVLAAVCSALLADYYFIRPYGHLIFSPDELFKSGIFLFECFLLILLSYGITAAYHQVQQNQLLFRSMIEKGTEGIVMINREGKNIYSSPSIQKIIGYTADEFLAMPALALVHEDELPHVRQQIREMMAFPGETVSIVHRIKHKNGQWIWVEDTITNLLNEPAVNALIANFYNITERVKIEEQREDFVSIASHELKTPVTTIKLLVQILRKQFNEKGDDRTTASLIKIEYQVNRITSLINDLFDITQLKQGQLSYKLEPICLNDLISGIVDNIQASSSTHQIKFNQSKLSLVNGDKERLSQVIHNLITNGIKYSPEADKVVVSTVQEDKCIKVTVQDFGIGIKKEELNKVFDRFYRAKNENTERQNGLGLGLYISADIIKKHNGHIGVNSELGKGSTFWFTLPVE